MLKQLGEQSEKMKSDNQKRIEDIDMEYSRKVDHLRDTINSLELELSELKAQKSLLVNGSVTESTSQSSTIIQNGRTPPFGGNADGNLSDENLPPPFSERKPGEGSENTDMPPQAVVHHSRGFFSSDDGTPKFGEFPSPVMPLEDLLTSDRLSRGQFNCCAIIKV